MSIFRNKNRHPADYEGFIQYTIYKWWIEVLQYNNDPKRYKKPKFLLAKRIVLTSIGLDKHSLVQLLEETKKVEI